MRKKILIVGVLLAIIPIITLAWDIGDPLVPCGTSKNPTPCSFCNIFTLGQNVVDFLTKAIAPALAVLAFALAGFKILISGGSPGMRQEGIKIIRNTIIGLLIVFGAWIIIGELLIFFAGTFFSTSGGKMPWNEIICISPVVIKEAAPPPTLMEGERLCESNNQKITVAQQTGYDKSHNSNKVALLGATIGITGSAGLCDTFDKAVPKDGSKATCTSVAYLPDFVIPKLKAIGALSGSAIQVTGATECGHQTHGFDMATVDLHVTTELTNYIVMEGAKPGNQTILGTGGKCSKYILNTINTTFVFESPSCGVKDTHWHADLNP